jgi:hypothetical protein
MAAYGVAYFSATFAGALSGFLASRFPSLDQIFDDDENFETVKYSHKLSQYDEESQRTDHDDHEIIPNTAHTDINKEIEMADNMDYNQNIE